MKKILLFLSFFLVLVSASVLSVEQTFAIDSGANNLRITGAQPEAPSVKQNEKLTGFQDSRFTNIARGGEQGIFNTLVQFARDLKNLFYIVATIFFLVISLRLILAENTEEELGRFKKGVIWITIGIIIMQIAFSLATVLFDQGVSARLAVRLLDNVIWPLINLLQTLASFFFITVAIFAFYRLVTANGNDEAMSNAKKTIAYAIIGYLVIRFAREIVEAFYGRVNCETYSLGFIVISGDCRNIQDLSSGIQIIITLINWINSFIAIIVVIMIIYAGVQILFSGGDQEKVKKGKTSILYIAIGIALLVANYLILTFFLRPETII